MDRTLQLVDLSCAIVAGNHDAGSDGDAVEKADKKKNQTSGRTDCREGIASEKVADDQRISSVVHLLKQISEKERKGEGNDTFPDRSLGQQCCLLCLIHNSQSFL